MFNRLRNFLPMLGLNKFKMNIKTIAIPSIMMSGYFLNNKLSQKYFSNKIAYSAEETKLRRLVLLDCENLQEGEMKQVKYGAKDDESILVVNYQGQLRALSNYCPHFGAPMHTGVLIDNVIKCPWHGASFDVISGKNDISPSIDDLPIYEIFKEGTEYFVNLPETVLNKVVAKMSKRDPENHERFVIIGGGPAGLSAAETLRQSGYTGEITILSKEGGIPYDRTMLSKYIPPNVAKIELRSADFLHEYSIDIVNEAVARSIDNLNREITLENGLIVKYDKLLLASGGSPLIPNIPGKDKPHVFTLRSFTDLEKIAAACKNAKNIVIVGGSFIGMESASVMKKTFKEANVTVIDMHATPFLMTLGVEVGQALQKLHETNGINFKLSNSVSEITDESVILKDGQSLPAEVVILGVGVVPNTNYAGTNIAKNGNYIKTDKYLNTSDENIFAAGDIASVPYFQTGDYLNFGHYVSAQQQGSIAAYNMLGKNVVYDYVPFFWTRHWDKALQYTGYGTTWDEVFVDGNLHELKFAAYYLKDNKIVGFAAMNTANAANIMYEAFRLNKVPAASTIKDGTSNLDTILKSLKTVKGKCSRADCRCEKKRLERENANKNI